jgi:hypothetical protein
MQWLLHGRPTVALGEALRSRGDTVHGVEELSLPAGASAAEVLEAARVRQWDVITTDSALPEAAGELARPFARSIVLLLVEQGDVEQDDAVERLFHRYKRLTPGRVYAITGGRVKVRQLKS